MICLSTLNVFSAHLSPQSHELNPFKDLELSGVRFSEEQSGSNKPHNAARKHQNLIFNSIEAALITAGCDFESVFLTVITVYKYSPFRCEV